MTIAIDDTHIINERFFFSTDSLIRYEAGGESIPRLVEREGVAAPHALGLVDGQVEHDAVEEGREAGGRLVAVMLASTNATSAASESITRPPASIALLSD